MPKTADTFARDALAHRLVIGIGNCDRGDDAAGRRVAQRLRDFVLPGVDILESRGEAMGLLGHFEAADLVYLVDAAVSGMPPGTIRRFDVAATALPPTGAFVSTHGFGVAEALELARALGRLPRRCVIYTVEVDSCTAGAPLTQAVAVAVEALSAQLAGELADPID
jgi:hydrogenase maturation protease